jgi:Dolichyl-phosphate-mannose-protein mannosyltransferase
MDRPEIEIPVQVTAPLRLWPRIYRRSTRLDGPVGLGLAVGLAVAYFALLFCFWSPAHPGVDQNAYFAGGRALATTGSTLYRTDDDLSFVGRMFVRLDDRGYYPKYPIGLPLLFAGCLWLLGGEPNSAAYAAAYLISPVAMSMSLLGLFLLTRRLAGGFLGLMAMLVFGINYLTLSLALNPNSHAATVCAVVLGSYCLIRFAQDGTTWSGVLAGLLLAMACLGRYTEGLLVLPLAYVLLTLARWKRPTRRDAILIGVLILILIMTAIWSARSTQTHSGLAPLLAAGAACFAVWMFVAPGARWRLAIVTIAWAVPVALQIGFNLAHFGVLTSYDGTNESTGFGLDFFAQNWERMFRTAADVNLFFFLPIGVAGMVVLLGRHTRVGVTLWLWVLPSALLYTAYYWAPDTGTGYARFFITQIPAVVVAAMWLLGLLLKSDSNRQAIFARVAVGVCVGISTCVGAVRARDGTDVGVRIGGRGSLEAAARDYLNLHQLSLVCSRTIPPGSIVFSDESRLHHFQWISDWSLFNVAMFDEEGVRRVLRRDRDESEPDPLDPGRLEFLRRVLADKRAADLTREARRVIQTAFNADRRVFVVLPEARARDFEKRHLKSVYRTKLPETWMDVPLPSNPLDRQPDSRRAVTTFRPNREPPRGRTDESQFWHVLEVLPLAKPVE